MNASQKDEKELMVLCERNRLGCSLLNSHLSAGNSQRVLRVTGAHLTVDWWPHSANRTAYVLNTKEGFKGATANDVIKMATTAPDEVGIVAKRNQAVVQKWKRQTLANEIIDQSYVLCCHWCGCKLTKETFTADHRIPLKRGGLDNANNLVPACEPCNTKRGSDMPELSQSKGTEMALIPVELTKDPTLEAVDAATQAAQPKIKQRRSIGMSAIDACARKNWYKFHHVLAPGNFDAKTLYRFEDGHRSEDVMAERLRRTPGIEIHTRDPATGKQIHVTDMGGHVQGYLDGLIKGLVQAPKTWHVWEHKSSSKAAELDKLRVSHGEKGALKEWNLTYYNQAQYYMGLRGLTRHYLTCTTPGGITTTSVRTDFDKGYFEALRAAVHNVIISNEPLQRISDKPSFYLCKWCNYSDICHEESLPNVKCRTCVHFAISVNGDRAAGCMWHRKSLSHKEQVAACDEHRYMPSLVTFAEQVDADPKENLIVYKMKADERTFSNGMQDPEIPNRYSSAELQGIPLNRICDPQADELRKEFNGGWEKI